MELKRRVQHYSYKYNYNYKSRSLDYMQYIGQILDWLSGICDKLCEHGIFEKVPDQIIINEYIPGQGIASHVDCISCFTGIICSLSLGSNCIMDFTYKTQKESIMLEQRSLLMIQHDARYKWKHGIAYRKNDKYQGNVLNSKRRISLTFRKTTL